MESTTQKLFGQANLNNEKFNKIDKIVATEIGLGILLKTKNSLLGGNFQESTYTVKNQFTNGLENVKDVKANRFAFIVQFDDNSIQTFGYPSYGGNTTRYPLPKNVVGESIYADADGSLGLVTSNGTATLFGKLASTIKPHAQCELADGVETLFEGRNWLHIKKSCDTMGKRCTKCIPASLQTPTISLIQFYEFSRIAPAMCKSTLVMT